MLILDAVLNMSHSIVQLPNVELGVGKNSQREPADDFNTPAFTHCGTIDFH